jgi:hypothetical protein
MPMYRLYLTHDGHVIHRNEFFAPTDEEAVQLICTTEPNGPYEIWDGARQVSVFKKVADGVGFEPTAPCGAAPFQDAGIGRSPNRPIVIQPLPKQ